MVQPCSGSCRTCQDGPPDKTGSCSARRCSNGAVIEGQCGGGECRDQEVQRCQFVCAGNGCTGTCVPGTPCPGTGVCNNDREIPQTRCDNNGRCSVPGGTACPNGLRCGDTRCLDRCSSDSNCVGGRVCVDGQCRTPQNAGGPCRESRECKAPAEFCVDNKCSHCRISCGPNSGVVTCDQRTRECRLTNNQLCRGDQECISNFCQRFTRCTTPDNDTADCSQSVAACINNGADCKLDEQGFCRNR